LMKLRRTKKLCHFWATLYTLWDTGIMFYKYYLFTNVSKLQYIGSF